MSRSALVLAALALAGCSSTSALPRGSTTITLFGPGARLDAWSTLVVDGVHVHAESIDRPCAVSAAGELGAVFGKLADRSEEAGRKAGEAMETACMATRGRSYGGRNRTALILRKADEALVVQFPRLRAQETERIFRPGEFAAAFERPLTKPEAALERGWVRALRGPSGTEYELFLVLKPAAPGAGYESLQVVTRVETPAR
jgi:hypothetical protein